MAITLDAAIEQRIQRQLDRGAFREPAELLAHALDLVETEAIQEGSPVYPIGDQEIPRRSPRKLLIYKRLWFL